MLSDLSDSAIQMSESGGPLKPRRLSCSLAEEATLDPGTEKGFSIPLDEKWRDSTSVERHPSLDAGIILVKGSVGEGSKTIDVLLKNCLEKSVTISKEDLVIAISDQIIKEGEDTVKSVTDEPPGKMESGIENGESNSVDAPISEKLPETYSDNSDETMESKSEKNDSEIKKSNEAKEAVVSPVREATVENIESTKPPFRDETQHTPKKSEDVEACTPGDTNGQSNSSSTTTVAETLSSDKISSDQETRLEKDSVNQKGDSQDMSSENISRDPEPMDTEDNERLRNNESSEASNDSQTPGDQEQENTSKSLDVSQDKPTIKLASFSAMGQPSQQSQNGTSSPVKGENRLSQTSEGAKQDACSQCARGLSNIFQSIVWETMQFCDEVSN